MPINDEITVGAKEFAAAVGWAGKWVATKPVVPVHAGLLLEVTDGALHVSATGENATARATVALDGLTTGGAPQRAIVSGRLLAELVSTFPAKPVTISGTDEGVDITVGSFRGHLPTLPEADYPTLPATLPAIGRIGGDLFAEAVGRVAPAVGRDLDKGVMFTAAHLTFGPDTLTVMATDRYRAARMVTPWAVDADHLDALGTYGPNGRPGMEALALGMVLVDAAASFAGPDTVEIGCDGRLLSLSSPSRSLVIQLIAGEYSTETVRTWLGWETTATARFTAADLAQPLKRAALMRGKDGPVRLDLSAEMLTIGSQADQIKQTGDEEIPVSYDGEPLTLGFNPKYLADALAEAPGDRVEMKVSIWRHPVIFKVPGNDAWTHIVVPVRLLS